MVEITFAVGGWEYFEGLLLPLTLIRYLNLNTRIWSKR